MSGGSGSGLRRKMVELVVGLIKMKEEEGRVMVRWRDGEVVGWLVVVGRS